MGEKKPAAVEKKADSPADVKKPAAPAAPKVAAPAPATVDIIDQLCPSCGPKGDIRDEKCRLCGARRTVNQVSGNVIWMRNGRIVRAFKDSRQAYVQMAIKNGIPESRWPEEFRTVQQPKKG